MALVEAARRDPELLVDLVGKVGYGYGHKLDSEGGTESVVERLRVRGA